jgi:hypothetical protein
MRTGRMSVNGRVLGPEEPRVSRTLFIITFWLKENSQHEPYQKGTEELDFIQIKNEIFPSYRILFNEFSCTEYPGVKPKTGKVRFEDFHTKLDAVQ